MNFTFFDFHLFPVSDGTVSDERQDISILAVFESGQADEGLRGFLEQVFSAAGLVPEEDVLSVNLTKEGPISFSNLIRAYPLQYTFIFGINPKELGINAHLALYQPTYIGQRAFLLAHSLVAIYEEREEKERPMAGQLWKSMKALLRP